MQLEIKLPSGKILTPAGGLIAINSELDVYDGSHYDGAVDSFDTFSAYRLSTEDRVFLAKHMIDLWKEYLAKADPENVSIEPMPEEMNPSVDLENYPEGYSVGETHHDEPELPINHEAGSSEVEKSE